MRMVNARRSTGSHHRQRLAGRCGLDPDPAPLRGSSHLRHFANAGLGRSSQRHRRCVRTGRCDSVPASPSSWALVASSAEGLAPQLARSIAAAGGHVASEHRRHHSRSIADAMIPSRATAVRGRRFALPSSKADTPVSFAPGVGVRIVGRALLHVGGCVGLRRRSPGRRRPGSRRRSSALGVTINPQRPIGWTRTPWRCRSPG